MDLLIRTLRHKDLNGGDLEGLRRLFDAEYFDEYGAWDPDRPYGYSPHDFHIVASDGEEIVGHVGFQRRTISVGSTEVLVGGTGGVLTRADHRRGGTGRRLMRTAQQVMKAEAAAQFGYLGCREEVVPFYESCGWHRIHVPERFRSRLDNKTWIEEPELPLLICASLQDVIEWPNGSVDLRGTPW